MKMEGSTERGHTLTTALFLFQGNLKEQLSFAKYVICTTVDFLSDLRMVVACFLKDSIKYYGGGPTTIVSTETPENAVSKATVEKYQMMRKVEKTEERNTCDPFRVRLSFSLVEKLKMTIFGAFLVPVRFVSVFLAVNLAWALSCIGLVGLDSNNSNPVTGWRKQLQQIIGALGRLTCTCIGFRVSKTGTQVIASHSCLYFSPIEQVSQSEAPVLVVAPHSTFFDALAVFWTGLPFIVNREENRRIPLIGKCIQFAAQVWQKEKSW